jgi:hypothetical protein
MPARMPAHSQGFRSEALTRALDDAVAGDARALYELLARVGGLPGPRANAGVVLAFANECVARGPKADALVAQMATLDVDAAPGASKYEIIPMCGVAALGARAASDAAAMRALATLHDCAEDLRFRVRDEVAEALARIGEARGEALAHDLASWMDGYFHAAAVLRALADPRWLTRIASGDVVIARLDEGFELLKNAPRATARYPGFKSLLEIMKVAPVEAAARFGVPVFDLLARWSAAKDPVLREIVSKVLSAPKLAGRFAAEVARTRGALQATEAPRRDPRSYVGPTRGRGKKNR